MKVVSNNDIIELWVPNDTDEALVQAVYEKHKRSCKLVVVYRSGKNDLVVQTQSLLAANI